MTEPQDLATIERVDVRGVWSNETNDFTPWIAEHISELGEALGLDLESRTTEAPVGGFALDILAHDVGRDRPVAIENQLEVTDHSHLGQLLTYAAGYDANVVVWIAREFKDEHREALDMLNRRTDEETEFFGVAVDVLKKEGSRLKLRFRVVSAPDDRRDEKIVSWQGDPSGRKERYREFFQRLGNILREEYLFTSMPKGSTKSYRDFRSGVPGFRYVLSFTSRRSVRVALHMDSHESEWNERVFDQLKEMRESLESQLGGSLNWEKLESRREYRISTEHQGSIDDSQEILENIRGWMIEKLLAFKRVFGPRLAEL